MSLLKLISVTVRILLLPINILLIPLAIIMFVVRRVMTHAEAIDMFIQRLEKGIRRKK